MTTLLEPFKSQTAFYLPDCRVYFSLPTDEEKVHSVDSVELRHKLDVAIDEAGIQKFLPGIVIPIFQKILNDTLKVEINYADAYHVYKLVEQTFEQAKKKFEGISTLPTTLPEVST